MQTAFWVVTIALSVAFWRLMSPFWSAFFLAFILAHLFRRPYRALARRTRRPPLAAGVTILLVIVVVAAPLALVTALVSAEIAAGIVAVQGALPGVRAFAADLSLPERLAAIPFIGEYIAAIPELDVVGLVRTVIAAATDFLISVSQRSFMGLGSALLSLMILLFLLYYFFVDGERILARVRYTIPLPNAEIDQFASDALHTMSATLLSTIVIGLMEGALAVLLFTITGLPSPFLWGVVVVVVSLIPMFGTSMVLIPAATVLLWSGRLGGGILMIVVGLGGIFITQNIIKPKMLGDRAAMHPAVALLSTMGGVAWLGLIGFVAGPVLAGLFFVAWRQFARRYAVLLQGKDGS